MVVATSFQIIAEDFLENKMSVKDFVQTYKQERVVSAVVTGTFSFSFGFGSNDMPKCQLFSFSLHSVLQQSQTCHVTSSCITHNYAYDVIEVW